MRLRRFKYEETIKDEAERLSMKLGFIGIFPQSGIRRYKQLCRELGYEEVWLLRITGGRQFRQYMWLLPTLARRRMLLTRRRL